MQEYESSMDLHFPLIFMALWHLLPGRTSTSCLPFAASLPISCFMRLLLFSPGNRKTSRVQLKPINPSFALLSAMSDYFQSIRHGTPAVREDSPQVYTTKTITKRVLDSLYCYYGRCTWLTLNRASKFDGEEKVWIYPGKSRLPRQAAKAQTLFYLFFINPSD